MSDKEIFATFAREHGLNEERVEAARENGLTMTALVTICSSGRGALEVNAMLVPLSMGTESADEFAAKARTLADLRSTRIGVAA
jgi:hypothetical protein